MKTITAIKKPIPIEAVQYTGDNFSEVIEWIVQNRGEALFVNNSLIIRTLEGDHRCSPGDYVIKGIRGEFYPCRKDIFEESYEVVKNPIIKSARSIPMNVEYAEINSKKY